MEMAFGPKKINKVNKVNKCTLITKKHSKQLEQT